MFLLLANSHKIPEVAPTISAMSFETILHKVNENNGSIDETPCCVIFGSAETSSVLMHKHPRKYEMIVLIKFEQHINGTIISNSPKELVPILLNDECINAKIMNGRKKIMHSFIARLIA
jgi:hypothetical protein